MGKNINKGRGVQLSGGISSVSGNLVNNADPSNPIINLPYKSYIARLNQSGITAPISTIIYNNLGFIPVWSYTSAGAYTLTSSGGFPVAKTFFPTYGQFSSPDGWGWLFNLIDLNSVSLNTYASGAASDGILFDFPFEIRVYL